MARRLVRLSELIPDLVREHDDRKQSLESGRHLGPVTGFETLDGEIGGKLATGVHVVQAAPGVGKTALGLQLSSDCEFPALFVTAELTPLVLFQRIIARMTRTSLSSLTSANQTTEELLQLADQTVVALPQFAILDASLEPAGVDVISEAAHSVLESAGVGKLLTVIDSLQVWSRGGAMGGFATDFDLISAGVHAARRFAIMLESPVLLVSHRSRAGQERGGLFASKGTGEIEYAAETVLELSRNPDAKPDRNGEVPVTLTILKNRHGNAGGQILLYFSGALQSFRHGTGETVSLNPNDFIESRKRKGKQ